MSIILKGGALITYSETELECPICTAVSDFSEKMDKAKYPIFDTKCPKCKGVIIIRIPIFGGTTECWEKKESPGIERGHTKAPFMVNGKAVPPKPLFEEDDDDEEEVYS